MGTELTVINPQTDVEVLSLREEAENLLSCAGARVICSLADAGQATDDLALITNLKRAIESKRKEYLQPFQDHIKYVNETYKTLSEPVEQADRIIRNKITTYQREQDRLRREQERINRERVESAQREASQRGDVVSEPVELLEVAPQVPSTIRAGTGSAGRRDNWTYEVVDFHLVPDDYKMINAGVLTPVVKASKGKVNIPGVRIYNDPILAVTTWRRA